MSTLLLMTTCVHFSRLAASLSQDRDMIVEDKKREHRDKRGIKAAPVISVAQVTAAVRDTWHVAIAMTRRKKYLITEKRECWRDGGEVTGSDSNTGYSMCFASCY